jgi:hypothetical protein
VTESGPRLKKIRRAGAVLLLAAGLAAAGWYFFALRPERLAREELADLAALLVPVVRAETLEPATLSRSLEALEKFQADSPAAREMLLGGRAFLNGDPQEAARRFNAVDLLTGGQAPGLPSFLAAASLRQGDSALASAQYLKALEVKRRQGADALAQSADQLGLSLSFFLLHQTGEARPLAEAAYQARLRALGPEAPETLTAANRLATLDLALGRNGEAEDLLKSAYQAARQGQGATEGALEEARLLLRLLYQQTGRQDELEIFFGQPPPAPQPETEAETGPGPGPEPGPENPPPPPRRPPLSPENLKEWEKTARELLGHDDALAADLLRLVMDQAEPGSPEYLRLSGLTAGALEGAGRLEEAEDIWHEIAEAADARLDSAGRNGPAPRDVALSLESHLKLADNYLRQGRTPLEAEIELKAAANRLGPRAGQFPETAAVYLRLARLLWSLERHRESADYYRQARALAEKLLENKAAPERAPGLGDIIRAAGEESPLAAAKKPAPDFLEAAGTEKARPSPELLRRELSALSALGRPGEFDGRLAPALAEAARLHGVGSPGYLRYYSLKLKALEEAGRVEELTRELRAQADRPPGRNEGEKALNRGNALLYAARVNEQAGRTSEAGELYRQALAAWKDLPDSVLGGRRQSAEEALKGLEGR